MQVCCAAVIAMVIAKAPAPRAARAVLLLLACSQACIATLSDNSLRYSPENR